MRKTSAHRFIRPVVAASLLVGSALAAQVVRGGQDAKPAKPLARVFQQDAEDSAGATDPASLTAEQWAERVTASDLDARERDFGALVRAARRDTSLVAAIEDWAADPGRADLAWTARLALRELRGARPAWLGARSLPQGAFPFDFDPFGDEQFDPRAWIEQFEQRFGQPGGGTLVLPGWPQAGQGLAAPGHSSSAESFSLSVSPGGVKCEVKRNVDGKEEIQEYEAATLEELLEAHPELRGKLQVGSAGGDSSFGMHVVPWSDAWPNSQWPWGTRSGADAVRTDILGVVVEPLAENEALPSGVERDSGLRIERVEPGTIAASLGLQRGQILVELNGAPIRTRDDITAEIKKRAADGALEATVIDRWGQRRTHTWKPAAQREL